MLPEHALNPVGIVGIVTLSAEAETIADLALAVVSLAAVLGLDVAAFHWSNVLSSRLNEQRMLVPEKVFGILIAAIAVQLVLDGLASAGVIAANVH